LQDTTNYAAVHGEFLIGPEILVNFVRVQTTAANFSTCAWRITKLTGILACDFSKLEFQWPSVALSGALSDKHGLTYEPP
jgi:hypothetical protein